MGDSLKAPLVPKEGYEPASAPPHPGYGAAGPSSSGGPVTGYPVIAPSPSYHPYPSIPPAGADASQPFLAPSSALVSAPPPVLVCHHDHHHCHRGGRDGQPERMACGACHRVVVPEATKEWGLCACITAVGLCASGCWPCACLPFCCNVTRDTVYRCTACHAEVYRRRAPFE